MSLYRDVLILMYVSILNIVLVSLLSPTPKGRGSHFTFLHYFALNLLMSMRIIIISFLQVFVQVHSFVQPRPQHGCLRISGFVFLTPFEQLGVWKRQLLYH